MHWFGSGGVLSLVGIAIITSGWLMFMRVSFRYRLHSSAHFGEGLKKLFSEEGRADRRESLLWIGVMFVGMCVFFPSMLMGDTIRNRPCHDACEAAGWERGRLRRSPHDVVNGVSQGPRQCWYNNSEEDWAPEPLDVPIPD
ncbi:MAG: hypothetical protein H6719_19545 [Sandaracinaceae bacterium]|nr:hypothetical protein [Sandaracinaceae bacterium]